MAEETKKNEDIPFKNKAIETIKQLSEQNNVLKSRLKSRNNQQSSPAAPQITGLRGLETRLGQQFSN